MIVFENVTKLYPTRTTPKVVLDNVSTVIPTDRNVGILGKNGAGKSTMLRLIARADRPTYGHIHTTARMSWPMAFGGGFQANLSAIDNIRFISRIYGVDWESAIDRVEEFAELGQYLHMPVRTFSSGMRARLNLGMSLAIHFDVYMMDEIPGVGDARFKKRFDEAFTRLRDTSSLILISHNVETVRKHCDIAFLLRDGNLTRFDNIEEALEVHQAS